MLSRRSIREVAFSWNIVSVIGCWLLSHVFQNFFRITETGGDFEGTDAGYWFRRAAIRLTDLLHAQTINSVTTDREAELTQEFLGWRLITITSFLAMFVVVLLLVKLTSRTRVYRVALSTAAMAVIWVPAAVACLRMRDIAAPVVADILQPVLLSLLAGGALLSLLSLVLRSTQTTDPSRPNQWSYAAAILSFLGLAYLWLPGFEHDLSRPRDINSLRIDLSRGPCYGDCGAYRMNIEGNGSVTFHATDTVRTSTITRDQLMQLLADFQRIHFFSIEDRAFGWCFDTPTFEISLLIDGKSKRIYADAGCVGAKSGIQARLAKLAKEIDTVTGSERWFDLARPSRRRTNPLLPNP